MVELGPLEADRSFVGESLSLSLYPGPQSILGRAAIIKEEVRIILFCHFYMYRFANVTKGKVAYFLCRGCLLFFWQKVTCFVVEISGGGDGYLLQG